jgi:hypothetical protein
MKNILHFKGGIAPPNLSRHPIDLQIAERKGVESFVRKLIVSDTTIT